MSVKLEEKNLRELDQCESLQGRVAVVDIDGVLRGKYLHINKLRNAARDGFGFCSVVLGWDSSDQCYETCDYTGWHNGYPDAHVQPDLETLRWVPWDQNRPFLLGDFYTSNDASSPLKQCPRQLLKSLIAKLEKHGVYPKCGFEFEWFNFAETSQTLEEKGFHQPKPITSGMFGYSLLRASHQQEYFDSIMGNMEKFRVPIEGLHTETGPGVYEAAIGVADGLEAADRAVLFKSSIKELAKPFGILPSFMARYSSELPGCSGHIHLSLVDKNGNNLFHDDRDKLGMSEAFRSAIAGLIELTPSMISLLAPNVNSYKRLVEGFWAPTTMTWGVDNRTCAIRVLSPSPKSTRLEMRVPGSDTNPYLALSAVLAGVLFGLESKAKLTQEPVAGNAYKDTIAPKIAGDLCSAVHALEADARLPELLSPEFVTHYSQTRKWEWAQWKQAVTTWERQRYFEII